VESSFQQFGTRWIAGVSKDLRILGRRISQTGGDVIINNVDPRTFTSGVGSLLEFTGNFAPPSGTGEFSFLHITSGALIDQSAGGTGVTRGIHIEPTLTAAADFRAIEVSEGRVVVPGITAAEDFKSGLAIVLGSDTTHDINVAAGAAQSFDLSQNIVFAAQTGKQLDVKWATGASAGMLGMPDLTSAIVLTFSLTASPDTITAGSGTPFAICNDGGSETGTIIIEGGDTNNGTYEVASCTNTVLTLGDGVLSGDETGDSGEYESRYVQPDTWYHIFLIESAGTEDVCADTSEIATNCLSESTYDQWRLLQSFFTGATSDITAGTFQISSEFVEAFGAFHSDTGTTTNSPGTPIKLVGTHTLSGLELLFDEPVDGRLRYTGTDTLTFRFDSHLSFTSDENNIIVTFEVAKNGTPFADSSASVKIGTGTDVQYMAVGYLISLATNDYLEAFIDTDGTGPDMAVVHLTLSAEAVN